jgi:DNA mismatch repair ATPase MutS
MIKILREKIEKEKEVLFILDEILKGTNSTDKTRGSKLFIRKIIELGGTGLIATHDTSLSEISKDFPEVILNKCFEIEIEGDKINFDFKLREGVTTRMNAALLMKEMGITE